MPIQNLSELQNITLEVPDPQLLQGWEPFSGAILYAERGKKYLIFSEAVEIRLPIPKSVNGEILFLKITPGTATIDPQTHTVDGSLLFTEKEGLIHAVATNDAWFIRQRGAGSPAPTTGTSDGNLRQVIVSAPENFLYKSGGLTVGLLGPLAVSISDGEADDTISIEGDNPLAWTNLPENQTIYFYLNKDGQLGYTLFDSKDGFELPPIIEEKIHPTMTGFTTPWGKVSASSYEGTSYPWYLFDEDSYSLWWTKSYLPQWIEFESPSSAVLSAVEIQCYYYDAPKNFSVQGYNEITQAWETVFLGSANAWTTLETKRFEFTNTKPYKRHRLQITSSYDLSSTTSRVTIASVRFFGQASGYFFKIGDRMYRFDGTAWVPDPLIFLGEAETNATEIISVTPYLTGVFSVREQQFIAANTNTAIATRFGTDKVLYSASLPAEAAGGGVLRWDKTHAIVRSSAPGAITLIGRRIY